MLLFAMVSVSNQFLANKGTQVQKQLFTKLIISKTNFKKIQSLTTDDYDKDIENKNVVEIRNDY
jgi:hypothetical protein